MNIFFYDIIDIEEVVNNYIENEIKNYIENPMGINNIRNMINVFVQKYYDLIFWKKIIKLEDILNDDNYIKIIDNYDELLEKDIEEQINIINNYKSFNNVKYIIDKYTNSDNNKYDINYIINNIKDTDIEILKFIINDYIKIYLKKNIELIKNTILSKLKHYKLDHKLLYGKNKNLKNNHITTNMDNIKKIIYKDLEENKLSDKLVNRYELIMKNISNLDILNIILQDQINIINNKTSQFEIKKFNTNNNLTLYINIETYKNLQEKDKNNINLQIGNMSYNYDLINENTIKDLKELYENKRKKFIIELSNIEIQKILKKYYKLAFNDEFYNSLTNDYNNDVNKDLRFLYKNIFNNLAETLNIYIIDLEDYINDIKNIEKILKYILIVKTDLIYDEKINNCEKIKGRKQFYLEMIHPVFVKKRYENEKDPINLEYNYSEKDIDDTEFKFNNKNINLKGYQKQCVLGLSKTIDNYITCYKYYFNTFFDVDENNVKSMAINNQLVINKLLLKTLQYRNNLFSVRFITSGTLPIAYIELNDEEFINILKNTSNKFEDNNKNFLYLGIVTKDIKQFKDYGNKIYYYIFYSKKTGLIMLKDHKLKSVSNTLDMSNETYTHMELSQLCFYLNLKAYKFKDNLDIKGSNDKLNEKMIFFSKYDIFDENEKYDEEVYNDYLTEEEFKETLNWYRDKLERIYCFKYPSLMVPTCLYGKIDDLKTDNIKSRNIYIYNDECKKLDYSYNKKIE